MLKNNAKKIFDDAIARKKAAQTQVKILVNKNEYDKIRADIDYLAMMSDIELEEVTENE